MKILWITPYGDGIKDGLATYARGVYEGFRDIGRHGEITIFSWNFQKKRRRLVHPFFALGPLIKSIVRSDVIHVQYIPGLYLFHLCGPLTLARMLGKRVVITFHERSRPNDPYFRIFFSYIHYIMATKIVVHTREHVEAISVFFKEKTKQIAHLVRQPMISALQVKKDSHTIVIPGFINQWKGVHIIIRAMPFLQENFKDIKLRITGQIHDVDYFKSLQDLTRELSLEKAVIFETEFLTEEKYWELLARARLIVLPYLHITMSGVVNDVVAVGTPFLTSNLSAFREIAGLAASYICVDSLEPEFWAKRMRMALSNKDFYTKLSEVGAEYRKLHSPANTAKAYLESYMYIA